MADYHIRDVSDEVKTVRCVFHITIPATNNSVGVAYRDALVEHLGGADNITSVLLGISTADLTKLKTGELLERPLTVRFSSTSLTSAERLSEVRAKYTSETITILDELENTLQYYGYSGSI